MIISLNGIGFVLVLFSIMPVFGQSDRGSPEIFKGYSIAYNINTPDTTRDDWEIMLMDMDGNGKINIINHPDVAWTYMAYRDRLFFISDRDTSYRFFRLYECDKDGRQVRKISDLRLEDSWMSARNNGAEIIVSGRIGKQIRYQLFILDSRTGTYRQLTFDTAAMFRDPCFSPDGNEIVVSYKQNRRDKSSHEELYIMDGNGKNLRQLTRYPMVNPSAQDYGYKAGAARWHPTENFITYVSKQDGRNSIFAITPDGSKQWKLLDSPDSEGYHDWSPDGRWLVFDGTDKDEKQYHIYLLNWQTKKRVRLTGDEFRSQLGPVFMQ